MLLGDIGLVGIFDGEPDGTEQSPQKFPEEQKYLFETEDVLSHLQRSWKNSDAP